jgi:protein-disulfide isomerase
VTIVEFSDFECPYCRRGYAALDEILDSYDGDVRLVYRHLPLPMHANAQMAAEASLAAHAQGKFWPFHDLLFNNQRSLSPDAIRGFAEELGLDMDAFSAALEAHTYADQVADDVRTARELGLGGTPSFMINGRPLVGAKPPAAFAEIIDEEIAAADELLADGVTLREVYRRRVEANLAGRPDRAEAEAQPAAQGAAPEAEGGGPEGEQSEP